MKLIQSILCNQGLPQKFFLNRNVCYLVAEINPQYLSSANAFKKLALISFCYTTLLCSCLWHFLNISNASTTFITTEQQDDNCAICQDVIEINQSVRRLTHCNHYFHEICIDTWFQRNVHCPTCRHDIRIVDREDQDA